MIGPRRVAVVVLNWNGWRDSLVCIRSLRHAVQSGLARVIVVDNGSTDGSAEELREWLQSVPGEFDEASDAELLSGVVPAAVEWVMIRAARNRGYAVGNNLGIRAALHFDETEYVFLLNNDAWVEPAAIDRLARCADGDSSLGIVGSTIVEDRGGRVVAGGARFNLLLTTSTSVIVDGGEAPPIDFVTGAAQFIRVRALKRAGLLNEDYFLYFEELDLTRRFADAGFGIGWCPESIVHHDPGVSAGSRSGVNPRKSALAEYHSNLSCLMFMRRFHPGLLWIAAPMRLILKGLHSLVHLQPALLRPLLLAYSDFARGMRGERSW